MSAAPGEHSRIDDRHETVADGHEQFGRNHAAGQGSVGGTRQPTQNGASPEEFVSFGENDPGAGVVKLEPLF
jgi:hypothetical protein